MEPIDAFSYYRLGAPMRDLAAIPEQPESLGGILYAVFEAQQALDELMKSGLEHSSQRPAICGPS